jgi:hypothetical protein
MQISQELRDCLIRGTELSPEADHEEIEYHIGRLHPAVQRSVCLIADWLQEDRQALEAVRRMHSRDDTRSCPHCGKFLPRDADEQETALNETQWSDADEWTPQNEKNYQRILREQAASKTDDQADRAAPTDSDDIARAGQELGFSFALDEAVAELDRAMNGTCI